MIIKDDERLNEEEQLFRNANPNTPRCHSILSCLCPFLLSEDQLQSECPQSIMMNNQPNSPTQPLSDLYSLQTIQIKKITLPIFDETKLPSSWRSQQQKVLEETALKELEVQQQLTTAIRCTKICLEVSLLTQEQMEQKLRELWHLYQMYYETKSIVDRFDRYLLDKHKPAIRALAILNPVWSLLKDDRFAVAATQRARGLFNWQCADLIEIFINIAKLEWNKPLCPGTSIEQFGLDLLRRILATDVECLYDAAIEDICVTTRYGLLHYANLIHRTGPICFFFQPT
jgi:hypothetical protein